MPRLIPQLVVLILVCVTGVVIGLPAQAQSDPFRHSPNAKRAQSQYHDDLQALRAQHKASVMEAGSRFKATAERHIQRYSNVLSREVRTLTRAGKIEAAYAVRALSNSTDDWEVTPPNQQGVHFLNQIDLAVEGSDNATAKGVDLLVDVEKAGVAYSKQVDAATQRYVEQVEKINETYLKTLERIRKSEQDAGRLSAVTEVTNAIERVKALPVPKRPDAHRDGPQEDTQQGDDSDQASDNSEEQSPSNRTNIFEGIDDNEQGGSRPLNYDKDATWAGYYLLSYSRNGEDGVKFLLKLDSTGGTLLTTSRQSQGSERNNVSIPIKVVRHNERSVLIEHRSDRIDSTTIHEIELVKGVPRVCKAWWSDKAYMSKNDPSQSGQILRMGNPDADLLSLTDGVYRATMSQTKNKANKHEIKAIQFEITVDSGHVMVSRHNKGTNEKNWSEWHAFILNVDTDDKALVMKYDQDEFTWSDLFVIDLSDKDNPVLNHWWRSDWRTRGDAPSSTGALIKQ